MSSSNQNPLQRPADIIGMPDLLDALQLAGPVPELPTVGYTRLKLSQIIPLEEDWWHLYLDRQHHDLAVAEAAAKEPHDPGFYYDNDKSPGFKQSLVEAYRLVLNGDSYKEEFDNATFTYAVYKEFYDLVTKYVVMPPLRESVNYGLKPGLVASDASTEMVSERPLLKLGFAGNPVSFVMGGLNPKGAVRCTVLATLAERPGLVEVAFHRFQGEIGSANNRRAQLTAIARLIRTLHVIHGFPDGNGRLNVYVGVHEIPLTTNRYANSAII
jgi:hypothetical protein